MLSAKSYRLLVVVTACALASIQVLGGKLPSRDLWLLALATGFCWAEFVRVDAKVRGMAFPRVMYLMTLLLAFMTVPYHLYVTRGARKTIGILLAAFLYALILVVVGLSTGWIQTPPR